jgi:hypothetical protein
MGKEFTFRMSKQIAEMSIKPLRTREEAILLILYTIRMFDVSIFLTDERSEKVKISIDKMNRIFYLLEGKMFSMQFPFCIDDSSNQDNFRIYHNITGNAINSMVLSFLIEVFEKMNRKEMDFDTIFEVIVGSEVNDDNFTTKEKWLLILHLLKYDLGYIRYDIDPEHENEKMHPLNHLDICLDTAATYKIGLNKKIEFDDFKNILDRTNECWYIS